MFRQLQIVKIAAQQANYDMGVDAKLSCFEARKLRREVNALTGFKSTQ